ncbi:hypothetical protein [Streptomyces erythrochromogenes]|uniref:hypothetical protein n=1 Tax=Streptomyces erythrochromogenes TaxID=285574 RepID=UPI0036AC2A5F
MTTAKPPVPFRGTAEDDGQGESSHSGAIRIGKWLFIPGSADRGATRNATLEGESLEIDLGASSAIFEDFLRTMSALQTDFGTQWGNATASATGAGERSGGSSRV